MSDVSNFAVRLTREQKEEIELLEMKACLALLDDQIVQLHRFRDYQSNLSQPGCGDTCDALMASVAHSTALARRMNARAQEKLYGRAHGRLPVAGQESLLN
jgi:hypothetical protein